MRQQDNGTMGQQNNGEWDNETMGQRTAGQQNITGQRHNKITEILYSSQISHQIYNYDILGV